MGPFFLRSFVIALPRPFPTSLWSVGHYLVWSERRERKILTAGEA